MSDAAISVTDLTLAYGHKVIQRDLTFDVERGAIFVIMGGSGCGKSTLLRNMLGLEQPACGDVCYNQESFIHADQQRRREIRKQWGVTFQQGGMISALTLAENLALPLELYTALTKRQREELIDFKLSLVGLAGYQSYYPSEISGGMRKRAALARAIMLDPEFLFFDEPSAGLDPISSRRLDELIATLAASMGSTVVMVTHELDSIFAIASSTIYLDNVSRTLLDSGSPQYLRGHSEHPVVREFLSRGGDRADRGQGMSND
ncbi:ABC-type transport system involved in resistance to organic solvent, ATPase component [Luminiphilus syltensis NOR5-1B]|uniref:ABC-type transport system involved in resistance to organic solvent, ATPase component n=1 Tax=Luminiphilus syltensis NOR5-1B TaxID=565045 RepID=B8KVH8_9GAMM|nr:ATP-binding cassette domain-containing protein [Luminiphilus syltensis]EED36349.1 ABC-type transport system involved in resistance to organic solvent, ATPase component [Luminiphilus syltensis NOR5-1B]